MIVEVLNAAHVKVGEIGDYDRLTTVSRATRGGSFQLETPASAAALLLGETAGSEIRVVADGAEQFSGPVLSWELRNNLGEQVMVFGGVDHLARLGWRWTDPEPGTVAPATPAGFVTNSHDVYSAVAADTVVSSIVADRCGATAYAGRQFLDVTAAAGTGPTITERLRFRETLGEAVDRICVAHDLACRVTVTGTGTGLGFAVWATTLKSDAPLGPEVGSVEGWTGSLTAPSATVVMVGGQGVLTGRMFAKRTNAASSRWPWLIETYSEHTEIAAQAELDAAGDAELSEQVEQVAYDVDVAAFGRGGVRYGRDFTLGDRVPLRIAGNETVATITAVTTEISGDGVDRRLTVGVAPARGVALAIAQARRADLTARRQRGA